MGRIWSEEAKYQAWLRVELAVCEAYARRGRIPPDALGRIRQKARVDIGRILAIQERVKHEMIALLTSLEEELGADSRFVHIGLTTNDVWDTATATPSSAPCWPWPRHRSRRSRSRCAGSSGPRCSRPRSPSARGRRARAPCRTSATRSSASASAGSRA